MSHVIGVALIHRDLPQVTHIIGGGAGLQLGADVQHPDAAAIKVAIHTFEMGDVDLVKSVHAIEEVAGQRLDLRIEIHPDHAGAEIELLALPVGVAAHVFHGALAHGDQLIALYDLLGQVGRGGQSEHFDVFVFVLGGVRRAIATGMVDIVQVKRLIALQHIGPDLAAGGGAVGADRLLDGVAFTRRQRDGFAVDAQGHGRVRAVGDGAGALLAGAQNGDRLSIQAGEGELALGDGAVGVEGNVSVFRVQLNSAGCHVAQAAGLQVGAAETHLAVHGLRIQSNGGLIARRRDGPDVVRAVLIQRQHRRAAGDSHLACRRVAGDDDRGIAVKGVSWILRQINDVSLARRAGVHRNGAGGGLFARALAGLSRQSDGIGGVGGLEGQGPVFQRGVIVHALADRIALLGNAQRISDRCKIGMDGHGAITVDHQLGVRQGIDAVVPAVQGDGGRHARRPSNIGEAGAGAFTADEGLCVLQRHGLIHFVRVGHGDALCAAGKIGGDHAVGVGQGLPCMAALGDGDLGVGHGRAVFFHEVQLGQHAPINIAGIAAFHVTAGDADGAAAIDGDQGLAGVCRYFGEGTACHGKVFCSNAKYPANGGELTAVDGEIRCNKRRTITMLRSYCVDASTVDFHVGYSNSD